MDCQKTYGAVGQGCVCASDWLLFGKLCTNVNALALADVLAHFIDRYRYDMEMDHPKSAFHVERPEIEPFLQVPIEAGFKLVFFSLDEEFTGTAGRDAVPSDSRATEVVVVRHQTHQRDSLREICKNVAQLIERQPQMLRCTYFDAPNELEHLS